MDAEVADAGVDAESIDAGMASDVGGSMDQEAPKQFRFDPDAPMYLGHSQGGVNGPLFLAVDGNDGWNAIGGGNIAITLEQKKRPFDIAGFAEMFVMIGDNEELDRWHHYLLVQSFIEPGTPLTTPFLV